MELICLLNELVPVTSADQRRRIHGDLYKKIASYSSDEIIKIVNGWTRPEAESKALYYLMLLDVAGERGLIKTHFEE